MHNLEILNDKEFEELARDLLEKEYRISFQIFKKGRDKGIDLRYSTEIENKFIVQAKHYIKSKFSDLKHSLIKIEKLNPTPERYIVITSLSMTPQEVDEIKKCLAPYVITTNDIFHFDRIQSLLKKYPDIEEKHHKLWLGSTTILKRVLNNAVKGKSQFYEKKILKKLSLFVPTKNFQDVVSTINENKFVIITGEPGVGKTTISYLLICTLMSKDFKLVYVDSILKDAEDVLTDDPEDKQVIFFDDFLGANAYEIINPRNSESSIIGFIERIQSLKNKYLILTTRTTILNHAEQHFERLRQSKLSHISKYQVELKQYSRFDKAKILYNHLYHSQLSKEYRDIFWDNQNYLKIIDHRNYSPRLIEFITSNKNLSGTPLEYIDHIFHNLKYPQEIWKGAFENQLSDDDRFLLTTLLSLGGYNVKSNHLEKAFESRLKYEINENGYKLNINAFNNSLRKLLESFIVSKKDSYNTSNYSFINPSVGDFLINYINLSKAERMRVLKSACYVDQWMNYFSLSNHYLIGYEPDEAKDLFKSLKITIHEMEIIDENSSLEVEILRIYENFFENEIKETDLIPQLLKLAPNQVDYLQLTDFIKWLNKYSENDKIRNIVNVKFEIILKSLYLKARYTEDFNSLKSLFNCYDRDFEEFMSDDGNSDDILERIAALIVEYFEDNIYSNEDLEESLVTNQEYGDDEKAISLVWDLLIDDIQGMLTDIDMLEYNDEVSNRIYIDETNIIQQMLEYAESESEELYPEGYYADNLSKTKVGNGILSESELIKGLFDQ